STAADANWAAAGMVDLFDDMHRRRARRRLWITVAVLVLTFAAPVVFLYNRLEDAQRQALLDEYDVQRTRLDRLPAGNPAVDAARNEAATLRDDAALKTARVGIQDLQKAIDLIYRAEQLSRDEKRLRELLNPVGEAVERTPWHDSSTVIAAQKTSCQQQHNAIVALLDQGRVADAEVQLAGLLVNLGDAQRQNVEALQTDTSRSDWLRLSGQIPERLLQNTAITAIRNRAEQGDAGWKQGDWINARLCFTGAASDLQKLLDQELTAEEKSRVQQADAERIARLEKEKADLAAKLSGVELQLSTLEKQIVQASVERSNALEQVNKLTADLAALQPLVEAGKRLPQVQATLQTRTTELATANQNLAKLAASEKSLLETKTLLEARLADSRVQVQELERGIINRRPAPTPTVPAGSKVAGTAMAAGMRMVRIQPGKFMMGSEKGDSDEQPVHEVEINRPFSIGRHEVTIGQILQWLNAPGVVLQQNWIDFDASNCPIRKNGSRYELNTSTKFGKSDLQPMVCISHHGAKAFCVWCSQQDPQHQYRLPWEAEWEYAARAGSRTEFPWGDSCNGTEANIDGNYPFGTSQKGPYLQVTTPVGAYRPNAWGLYDTVGNVWEWCGDWYDSGYYQVSPKQDPQGPSSGRGFLCRSGSWYFNGTGGRSGYRYYDSPDSTYNRIGFRVVAE
ncbi:MAG: SUMF1/EgtB/PvdO family nonheme iron enzyme, partial [Planctomycetaceae bacterium]